MSSDWDPKMENELFYMFRKKRRQTQYFDRLDLPITQYEIVSFKTDDLGVPKEYMKNAKHARKLMRKKGKK